MSLLRTFKRRKFRLMIVAFCCVAITFKLMTAMDRSTDIESKQTNVNSFFRKKNQQNNEAISKYYNTSNQLIPLNDYFAFPCANELPLFPEVHWMERGKCVRTINDSYHANSVASAECVALKTMKGSTLICIHDAKADIHISKSLKASGGWETNLVWAMSKKLKTDPKMQFLDLGCNIGVYSLSAAVAGTRVVAVDPLIRNLQLLSKSLNLGNLRNQVTLIWNGVANHYSDVSLLKYDGNVGGTAIQEANMTRPNETNGLVRTIQLDDLRDMFKGKPLGIKMDIETQELNALRGGTVFFEQVDVRFIQMEINWHRRRPSGLAIVDFLADRNFLPYRDAEGAIQLDPKLLETWPGDVYFIRTGPR